LTKIITAGEAQVTIYPDKASSRNVTRFFPQWVVKTPLNVTLEASVNGNALTFAGSIPLSGSQFNVHTLLGSPLQDVYVPTVAGDTPNTIATKVAAAIIASAIPGVSAVASGATVNTSGSPNLVCNVGGSATLAQEVGRDCLAIQISVWAPDEAIRGDIEDAIVSSVGTVATPRITLPDGSKAVVRRRIPPFWSDDHEQDFSMYMSHMFYTVEYAILQMQKATQIGAWRVDRQVGGVTLPSIYEG
jgi:hypothetical protein